jgi:hypothetical protein
MAANLSFVTPKRKKYLDIESKILIIFTVIISFIIVIFSIFLFVKGYAKSSSVTDMNEEIVVMNKEIESFGYETMQIKELQLKADEVYTTNELLKSSIKNLFDLVPDQITLTKSVMEKNRLVLYGMTPTKEVYNFLLLSPLKSIFHENRTTFYSLENGWYRFVSVNVLHDDGELVQ